MKIELTFKDPDGVWQSLSDAAKDSVDTSLPLSKGEIEDLIESRKSEFEDAIKPWVLYGEYITVEIDTEVNTATVKRAR